MTEVKAYRTRYHGADATVVRLPDTSDGKVIGVIVEGKLGDYCSQTHIIDRIEELKSELEFLEEIRGSDIFLDKGVGK